jgi:4-hydroxy-4-methyl-2-oxoglutarate aldolase
MFIIKDRAPKPDDGIIDLLKRVEPATVGHFRHYGFMDPAIRPVIKKAHIVGPALTVRTPGADSTIVHKAMGIAEPGDVIVIDRCGDRLHACWGGVVTLAAHLKAVAGGIIDGPATDVDEIAEHGFPLYCRGVSAMTTKLLGFGGEINTVIQCGGVTVHPGDFVIADSNGILVLRPQEAASVAEKALAMQESEEQLIKELKAGKSLSSLTRANAIISETAKR